MNYYKYMNYYTLTFYCYSHIIQYILRIHVYWCNLHEYYTLNYV